MGRPKATLDWHGRPLIRQVVEALSEAGCAPIVVVIAADGAPWLAEAGLPASSLVVSDEQADQGPLRGLATGLRELHQRGVGAATPVFVAATDLPRLTADVVRSVVGGLIADPDALAAVPVVEGRLHPLAAAYRLAALAVAERLLDEEVRRVTDLVGALSPVVRLTDLPPAALTNLNDPDDYARALR